MVDPRQVISFEGFLGAPGSKSRLEPSTHRHLFGWIRFGFLHEDRRLGRSSYAAVHSDAQSNDPDELRDVDVKGAKDSDEEDELRQKRDKVESIDIGDLRISIFIVSERKQVLSLEIQA